MGGLSLENSVKLIEGYDMSAHDTDGVATGSHLTVQQWADIREAKRREAGAFDDAPRYDGFDTDIHDPVRVTPRYEEVLHAAPPNTPYPYAKDAPCGQARIVEAGDPLSYSQELHNAAKRNTEALLEAAPEKIREANPIQNVLRVLPHDPADRKDHPIVTGVLDYFPLAIAAVARVSKAGNDQHNPGEPLHWARNKSNDHVDCVVRHLIERGSLDVDGQRHTAKAAWRVLAILQEELEREAGFVPS